MPPMKESSGPRYDAFLCHRRSDGRSAARWLRRRLLAFRIPRGVLEGLSEEARREMERPLEVYLDRVYEGAGPNYWTDTLRPALDATRHLVVLWTPESGRRKPGDWDAVWKEVEHFVTTGREDRILLVLAKGDERQPSPADLLAKNPLREFRRLTDRTLLRFLALPRLFALNEEVEKIAGRLYGVPVYLMPELHREKRRGRLFRLSAVAAAVLALLGLVSVLLFRTSVALGEANRSIAEALAANGVLAAAEAQRHKAAVYLAEARRRSDGPHFDAISILVGPPVATRAGRMKLGTPVRSLLFAPARNQIAVAQETGIHLVDLATGRRAPPLGGSAGFEGLRFDAEGRVLARRQNDIGVWDLASPTRPVAVLDAAGHKPLETVAFGVAGGSGGIVAYGRPDGTVDLRSLETRRLVRTFGPLDDWVKLVAASPDGRVLAASAGNSSAIQVWDARTGEPRTRLDGETYILTALEFSPDSSHLATAGADGMVKVFRLGAGEPALETSRHSGFVWALAFSPDGKLLATGGEDATLRLWSLERGIELARLDLPDGAHAVAFSPDGALVAAAAGEVVCFFRVEAERAFGVAVPQGDSGPASIAFSPDGERLALGASLGMLWDHATEPDPYLSRESAAYRALGLQVPAGLSMGYGATRARLIDPRSGAALGQLEGETESVRTVAFNDRGDVLAGGGMDGGVVLWSAASGRVLRRLAGEESIGCLSFGAGSALLAAGGWDDTVYLWRLSERSAAPSLRLRPPAGGRPVGYRSVAVSRDGELVAAQTGDGKLLAWDVESGQPVPARSPEGDVPLLASPGLDLLVARTREGRLRLLDPGTGQVRGRPFSQRIDDAVDLAFTPDGGKLLVARSDGSLEVWKAGTQRLLVTVPAAGRILALDPTGSVLVTDLKRIGSLVFWDVETGANLGALRYEERPDGAMFDLRGSRLAVWSSYRRRLRLFQGAPEWEVERAEEMSGFQLQGLSLVGLPAGREDQLERRGLPAVDLAAGELWRATWQVKSKLETMPEDAPLSAAAVPLRQWLERHCDHPLASEVPRRLEQLLAALDTAHPSSSGSLVALPKESRPRAIEVRAIAR